MDQKQNTKLSMWNQDQKNNLSEKIAYFNESCPGHRSETTLDIAEETIQEFLTPDEFTVAVNKFIEKGTPYFPNPVELIGLAKGTAADREMELESMADEAWGELVNGFKAYSGSFAMAFNDPVINHAVNNLGGWAALTHAVDGETKFIFSAKKSFTRQYILAVKSGNIRSDSIAIPNVDGESDNIVKLGLTRNNDVKMLALENQLTEQNKISPWD